jgi:hypothetical protein
MSKQRITIEVLASGQPRPYADSRLHVRATFEHDWNGKGYQPSIWTEDIVKAQLIALACGFPTTEPADWASPVLRSFEQTAPGVWEFVVTEAYTD